MAQTSHDERPIPGENPPHAKDKEKYNDNVHANRHEEDLSFEFGRFVINVCDIDVLLVQSIDERLKDLRGPLEW